MAVMMSGTQDFRNCPDCDVDFNDLVTFLDAYDGDDIDTELKTNKFKFSYTYADIRVIMRCGGSVFFSWDNGLGNIQQAHC